MAPSTSIDWHEAHLLAVSITIRLLCSADAWSAESRAFLDQIQAFLTFALPLYVREGKAYLTIAIGCTGGRHRSVVLADELAHRMRETGYDASVRHRDVERE